MMSTITPHRSKEVIRGHPMPLTFLDLKNGMSKWGPLVKAIVCHPVSRQRTDPLTGHSSTNISIFWQPDLQKLENRSVT